MKQAYQNSKFAILAATLAASVTACGPDPFVPGKVNQSISPAGYQEIPPKIDIVLGIDTGGNIANIFNNVQSSFQTFINDLEDARWDYRFTVLPLTTNNSGSNTYQPSPLMFGVSHFDGYWNQFGLWQSPYPGATANTPNAYATATSSALFPSTVNGGSGIEPGLLSLATYANRSDVNAAGINRSDALLAVLTLSADEDTSGGTLVPANQALYNQQTQNGQAYTGSYIVTNQTSIGTIYNQFLSVKNNDPSKFKFYAMVSHQPNGTPCRGTIPRLGSRYAQMADASGGLHLDICTKELPTMLRAVRDDITANQLPYRLLRVVLKNQPNADTLSMTATVNGQSESFDEIGASNCATLNAMPNPTSGGFHYLGKVTSALPTVEYIGPPAVPMSSKTGYMVELCGTARLTGSEKGTISYQNEGATTSQ
jgi:hypothetical protein